MRFVWCCPSHLAILALLSLCWMKPRTGERHCVGTCEIFAAEEGQIGNYEHRKNMKKYLRNHVKVRKAYIKLFQELPRCIKMCQELPECIKMCQELSKCIKMEHTSWLLKLTARFGLYTDYLEWPVRNGPSKRWVEICGLPSLACWNWEPWRGSIHCSAFTKKCDQHLTSIWLHSLLARLVRHQHLNCWWEHCTSPKFRKTPWASALQRLLM